MDFESLRAKYDKLVKETEALERKLAELADERRTGEFEIDLDNFWILFLP
jgi:cell division protein FtsB